jgi:hypothetical protein
MIAAERSGATCRIMPSDSALQPGLAERLPRRLNEQ